MKGRKPVDEHLKAKNPIYVSDWTKSNLDGLVRPGRKTYEAIIRSLIHTQRSASGVAKARELERQKQNATFKAIERAKRLNDDDI